MYEAIYYLPNPEKFIEEARRILRKNGSLIICTVNKDWEYQELANTTKKTASRDMIDLVEKEILNQIGTTGKGTYYILRRQRRQRRHKGRGQHYDSWLVTI